MIEIIAIGDEVLFGYTLNGNASFLSKLLSKAGFPPTYHHVCGDDEPRIKELFLAALSRGSFVIVTGGLGPTLDDYTRQIIADFFDVPLEFNSSLLAHLQARFGDLPALRDQSHQPRGAILLDNKLGSASGLVMRDEKRFPGGTIVALPGVPQEMRALSLEYLVPLVKEAGIVEMRECVEVLHFMRLWESTVDPLLRAFHETHPGTKFGIYPGLGVLTVHIKAKTIAEVELAKEALMNEWGSFYYESTTGVLQEALHHFLLEKKITLATAESCTGGALAARFVTQSGASSYFQGAVVAYTNDVKMRLLQVQEKTLQTHGAVSVEVTSEMAEGAKNAMQAMCAIAVSGILGPSGGSKEKPVGTIAATIRMDGREEHSWVMHMTGNREVILEKAVNELLCELFCFLRE